MAGARARASTSPRLSSRNASLLLSTHRTTSSTSFGDAFRACAPRISTVFRQSPRSDSPRSIFSARFDFFVSRSAIRSRTCHCSSAASAPVRSSTFSHASSRSSRSSSASARAGGARSGAPGAPARGVPGAGGGEGGRGASSGTDRPDRTETARGCRRDGSHRSSSGSGTGSGDDRGLEDANLDQLVAQLDAVDDVHARHDVPEDGVPLLGQRRARARRG